jgi:hypothetical protein
MTGVELILAALVAGAGAGVSDTAKTALLDAYAGFRDALRRRLAGRNRAERVLEAAPDQAGVWDADLIVELAESGAGEDEVILSAARAVLAQYDQDGGDAGKPSVDARHAKGVQVGDHNTQQNSFS